MAYFIILATDVRIYVNYAYDIQSVKVTSTIWMQCTQACLLEKVLQALVCKTLKIQPSFSKMK